MLDLFFNPEYAKVYKEIDGPSETFHFDCEYGSVQNTFIMREVKWKINGKIYYDIVTPYGYGGPVILTCKDTGRLVSAYKKAFTDYCRDHDIVCEFIRFHLFDNVNFREKYYGETVKMLDNVIVDTTGSYDDIYMKYNHKVRKNVKKALRNGLEMTIESNTQHLNDFLDIYYETMDRNNAGQYYYFKKEYFENIAERIPENYVYFYVLKDGSVISSELVLCSQKYAYSFLGGTDQKYYPMRPNDFLKDAIIKWCNKTGREIFILGGGYSVNDGIYQYKRSFTSTPDVPFYVGKTIFNQEIYNQLVAVRAAEDEDFDEKSSFFPLYRA